MWGCLVMCVLLLALGGWWWSTWPCSACTSATTFWIPIAECRSSSSPTSKAAAKIAIISVEGVILKEEGFVKRQIDRAAHDPAVKGVVLRVDSPGGTVTASDYLYHHLCRLRENSKIPIVVSMGGIAASGGYYVSMAVGEGPGHDLRRAHHLDRIDWGVIPHYNFADLMKDLGRQGRFDRQQSAEDHGQLLQAHDRPRVADLSDPGPRELRGGCEHRQERPEQVPQESATARTNWPPGALPPIRPGNGLIDEIGYLDAAVNRAIQLAGLSEDIVRVVKYKRESPCRACSWKASPSRGGRSAQILG